MSNICFRITIVFKQLYYCNILISMGRNLLVYMQAIKALFLYLIICLSVKLGSFSCLFKWISFLTKLANLCHLTEIKHLACLHFIQLFYSSLYPNRQIKIFCSTLLHRKEWPTYVPLFWRDKSYFINKTHHDANKKFFETTLKLSSFFLLTTYSLC